MEADEHQRRVIDSRARTIRLVAPAGSGKTGTIVGRVLKRMGEGVAPGRILLLTFDRSAAASLASRLRGAAGGGAVPRVSTLNAFGYRLLRDRVPAEHAPLAPPQTALRLAAEGLAALARARPDQREALPAHVGPEGCLSLFALLKNAALDPANLDLDRLVETLLPLRPAAAFLPLDGGVARVEAAIEGIAWLYRDHDAAMRRAGLIDFDDQKLRACRAIEAMPALGREVRGAWDEVVVDEFQDVNRLDFELVRSLARRATLLVAGDDDQAIYGFRGCTSEYIVDLERHAGRSVASYELSANYRSPPEILAVADRLIRHNRGRIPKNPVARRVTPAEIHRLRHDAVEAEADGLAEWVVRTVRGEGPGARWSDVALLVRLHAQAVPVAEALRARGVPVAVEAPDDGAGGGQRAEDGRGAGRRAAGVARPPPADAVQVRTYFKAKGSQWPTVVLPGCVEGVIPHERAPVEDERRLFYVGLTRASKRLLVSWVEPRGGGPRPRPSRFLREAGLLE